MENNESRWTEEILQSMKGSQRAQPHPDVLSELQEKMSGSSAIIIPMQHWRKYAAVALLILFANTAVVIGYVQNGEPERSEMRSPNPIQKSLTTSFQLYN